MISSATASRRPTPPPSGPVTQTYLYNANDELTSHEHHHGDVARFITMTLMATRLRSRTATARFLSTYTWDPRGRMIGATTGGNTVSYTYDDAGNRTSETVNGQTTTFLNDPNQAYDQVLEEYAEGGVLAATYIRGIDLLFEDQSGVRCRITRPTTSGSTRALTNSAGAVTDTYSYDAYGNLIASTGTTVNPYLFTGQWFDAAIGQYYDRARDYNPVVGWFTSQDTFNSQAQPTLSDSTSTSCDRRPGQQYRSQRARRSWRAPITEAISNTLDTIQTIDNVVRTYNTVSSLLDFVETIIDLGYALINQVQARMSNIAHAILSEVK